MDLKRPLQVLVVDDEEPFRKVIAAVLREKGGFEVLECESGEASIEDPSRYTKVEYVHQELSAAFAAE